MAKDWKGNGTSIYKALGASNHTEAEREDNDYYATDPIAIDKLLAAEKPYRIIWECACGQGHLSDRLKKNGFMVFSSDLIDRGYPGTQVKDFLTANPPPLYLRHSHKSPVQIRKGICVTGVRVDKAGKKGLYVFEAHLFRGQSSIHRTFQQISPKNSLCFQRTGAMRKERRFSTDERYGRLCRCLRLVCLGKRQLRRHGD